MAVYKIIKCGRRHMKDAAALSLKVFGSTFFRDNYMKEPWFKPSNIIMLYENNIPASMACILPRAARLNGKKISIAGIGGVATAPEFRSRGYASKVMKAAVRLMKKRGFDASLLYPYKEEFYTQFGYRSYRTGFRVLPVSAAGKPSGQFKVKSALNPDYRALKKIYDSFSLRLNGPFERPLTYWKNYSAYWNAQAKKMKWRPGLFFCAYEKGRMPAYIRTEEIRKTWETKTCGFKVSEFGFLPGREAAFTALLYAAGRHALKLGYKEIIFDRVLGLDIAGSRLPTAAEKQRYAHLKDLKMLASFTGRVSGFYPLIWDFDYL